VTDGLLLVHAFPLDARMWEPQLSAFSDALPLAAPHLPGFGGSDSAGEVMTMGAAAQRCLGELDRTGIDRPLSAAGPLLLHLLPSLLPGARWTTIVDLEQDSMLSSQSGQPESGPSLAGIRYAMSAFQPRDGSNSGSSRG